MFRIKEKEDTDFHLLPDYSGYYIGENYTLHRKQYDKIKSDICGWEQDVIRWKKEEENEIDIFTGLPEKDLPQMFCSYKANVTFESGEAATIIIFNEEYSKIFLEKKPGTTFLFLPLVNAYDVSCTKGEFLENGVIRKFMTTQELTYRRILEILRKIKEKAVGRKVEVGLYKTCSVEGYETNITKVGVIKSFNIEEEYGTICVYLYFEDGDEIETEIYNDVSFSVNGNEYCMRWAGATATDELNITILC